MTIPRSTDRPTPPRPEPPPAVAMEEALAEEIDIHFLNGTVASYILWPEDVFAESATVYEARIAGNNEGRRDESLVFERRNICYVSRRPRTLLRAKTSYVPVEAKKVRKLRAA